LELGNRPVWPHSTREPKNEISRPAVAIFPRGNRTSCILRTRGLRRRKILAFLAALSPLHEVFSYFSRHRLFSGKVSPVAFLLGQLRSRGDAAFPDARRPRRIRGRWGGPNLPGCGVRGRDCLFATRCRAPGFSGPGGGKPIGIIRPFLFPYCLNPAAGGRPFARGGRFSGRPKAFLFRKKLSEIHPAVRTAVRMAREPRGGALDGRSCQSHVSRRGGFWGKMGSPGVLECGASVRRGAKAQTSVRPAGC